MSTAPQHPTKAIDHYPTPPEATRALLSVESFGGGIWEPCAGNGVMLDAISLCGYDVVGSTIEEGSKSPHVESSRDFLQQNGLWRPNIITNPPYRNAEAIIQHALDLKPAKAAFFLNIKFLSSVGRMRGLFAKSPPSRVWVMADRVTMYPADHEGPKATTTETHAWFVFETPCLQRYPQIGWLCSQDFKIEESQGDLF